MVRIWVAWRGLAKAMRTLGSDVFVIETLILTLPSTDVQDPRGGGSVVPLDRGRCACLERPSLSAI
jgi:hypothetical protein